MFHNEKNLSFSRTFLLIVMAINILVVIAAYINRQDLFWALIWLVPLLVFAFYYNKIICKKVAKDREIDNNDFILNLNGNPNEKEISIVPREINPGELIVLFGNSHCAQPYLSSIICFESVNADQNIKFMPKQIVLSEDNGYTQEMMERLSNGLFSKDSIWRVGPDYAGCRDHDHKFNAEAFRENAAMPNVKMIELKLSKFNDKDNISARNISYAKQTNNRKYTSSNAAHTAFYNAESMVIFLDSLKQLSGKKPVGISLHITDKKEFHEMCYAFCKTGIIPDFIVVEGCEEKNSFLNKVSLNPEMPLFEALQFVSKTLEIYGLSKETKIIAASEIYTAFDVLKLSALGADAISMRNYFTHGDKPYQIDAINSTGFARQCMESLRSKILNSTMNIMQAWGYLHIEDITLSSFFRSLDALQSRDGNRKYSQETWNVPEKKSHRLPQKGIYEKNTGAEVFLN